MPLYVKTRQNTSFLNKMFIHLFTQQKKSHQKMFTHPDNMLFKHNIKAVLNKDRKDKNGKSHLRIRTTIKRKVSYVSTNIILLATEWDGRQIINHPNKVLLNIALRDAINKHERKLLESAISGEAVTKAVNSKITFDEYANKKILEWTGKYSPDSIKHRKSYLVRVNEKFPGIKLKDITPGTLNLLEDYCRKIGNADNTIVSYTKFVKTVINCAVEDKLLTENKLLKVDGVKYKNPLRTTLTMSEVEQFEGFADNPKYSVSLRNVASYFVFACYCGLRYADVKGFKGLKSSKVLVKTEKTGSIVSIHATTQIIRAVGRLTKKIIANQKCNEALKTIAEKLDIDKDITFHTARHSFATNFITNGGRLEVLARLMGHSTTKTTSIYAKISDIIADAEMKKVWDAK